MQIGSTQVVYTNIYSGEDITGIKVEVRVPATDGDVTGYVVLGAIDGWTLSENNTKLTKTYTTNETEVITISLVSFNGTIFDNTTTMKSIEAYGINASEYVKASVSYNLTGKTISSATVTLKIKDGKNYLFDDRAGWTVSSDGKKITSNVITNHNKVDSCVIYPSDQTHTAENEREETFSYTVKQIGLTVGTPIISYSETGQDKTIATKASILVPWTLESDSGYAVLSNNALNGWNLEESNRKLTKTYYENEVENIAIPVLSCNDYTYDSLTVDATVTVNQINYKKTVKGICSDSRCLYDTYTKEEIDNFKLQLEARLKELESNS